MQKSNGCRGPQCRRPSIAEANREAFLRRFWGVPHQPGGRPRCSSSPDGTQHIPPLAINHGPKTEISTQGAEDVGRSVAHHEDAVRHHTVAAKKAPDIDALLLRVSVSLGATALAAD